MDGRPELPLLILAGLTPAKTMARLIGAVAPEKHQVLNRILTLARFSRAFVRGFWLGNY